MAMFAAIIVSANTVVFGQVAASNASFSVQGMLSNTTGTAVADGNHTIVANVYLAGTSTIVYTETQTVTTIDGLFATTIGVHGSGGATLSISPSQQYDLGISVDGGTELMPHLSLVGAIRAATADIAANASAVGGFGVSTADSAKANTVIALGANGKLHGSIIDTGIVRAINGASGDVQFQGGGDLNVSTQGNLVSFTFNGTSGTLAFPFSKSLSLATGIGFSVNNALAGSAGSFSNTGIGTALELSATTGSAIVAHSNGALLGNATVEVHNDGGVAINAIADASNTAVLKVQNTSANANAQLVAATDASGSTVFGVAATGRTTIASTVADALDVSTNATGEAALKVTGGLALSGPIGTSQIMNGQTSVMVTNPYAKANSIIIITPSGAGGTAVPLQVSAQANGSFMVSVMTNAPAVTGNAGFSYLIVNQ